MRNKKFVISVLFAFITGTILLIYIQFNSQKNINTLIEGNNKYLEEYNINSELKGLVKDVLKIESDISNVVSTNDSEYIKDIHIQIDKVQEDLHKLQKLAGDDSTSKEIDRLDAVVQQSIVFNQAIADAYYNKGKTAAEEMISTLQGKRLMDSVYQIAQNIENGRHRIIVDLTFINDKSGQNAQLFNSILVGLILVCGGILFWYIINTVQGKEKLIQQLHESEKMVKETARVKEQFMANMSHEIRTPMNAILGFTNLLSHQPLQDEPKEYVETIRRSGENLLTIINDVLDLSKIEAGMMKLEKAPFSIRELLQSIEVMFSSKAREKGLAIYMDVEETVPETLIGDATRLTQILVNLMGNALKFTNTGSISVKITGKGKSESLIDTSIIVSDTGIGIDQNKQAYIFDRFNQADDTTTRHYGGTGLGLSIVKELVLLQNGTIQLKSEPGKGTDFILTIPYQVAQQQPEPIYPANPGQSHLRPLAGTSILLAEDNEVNQSLVKHLFKKWEIKFDLARNGREALDKLRQQTYDLVLMDIQMPEMDGYTTTMEIRKTLQLPVPVIAMTAHALAGEKEKCLSYGMNDYISKPIRETLLYNMIIQYTSAPGSAVPILSAVSSAGGYKYINLDYMKEISGGNTDYERTVTEQFIEAVPEELSIIEQAWRDKNITDMRQSAHNMKTTISVMGLNEKLEQYLHLLEYEELDEMTFTINFRSLKLLCEAAIPEARAFYNTLG